MPDDIGPLTVWTMQHLGHHGTPTQSWWRSSSRRGYQINSSETPSVIDTAALIDALRSQRIAGAGLDVVEGEPNVPPQLPELQQFDSVVVTPHIAGRAPEARTTATAMILS